MRRAAHRGLHGAPWHWVWLEFHRRAVQRVAEEGDGFGRVPGAIAGRVHNGFHPRRREADVWGLQDTGPLGSDPGRKTTRAGFAEMGWARSAVETG
jgi:hypothetical protein